MRNIVLMALISSLAAPAFAQQGKLIVVEDKGGTPTEPYFRELGLLADEAATMPLTANNKPIKQVKDSDMLPVRSELLSPGKVESVEIQAFGITPFFLIGDDALSKQWLVKNKAKLIQLKARGMVVNVATANGLASLKALAPELYLAPIAGDDIAKRLSLKHYPVLITSGSIEQ